MSQKFEKRKFESFELFNLVTFYFLTYLRSEPSSRNTLNGEQPYPWELLHPRDVLSRHRGAEHRRRSGRLGGTSLLSPE